MPTIKVKKAFKVRFAAGEPMREFPEGEHELTKKELDNWFVQGCLANGRATPVVDLPTPSREVETEGTVQVPGPDAAQNGRPSTPAKPKRDRMLAAFPDLKEGDFKKNGVPTVMAMEKALGETVSAEEVEQAWTSYCAKSNGA